MSETLSQTIKRLLQADAEYKAFVRTTRSHQLACEGVRDAMSTVPNMSYDHWKTTNPDDEWLGDAQQWTEKDDLTEEDRLAREEAEWQQQDRKRNQ